MTQTALTDELEAVRPGEPRVELRTKVQPAHDDFTRYLTFRHHDGREKRLAVAFRRDGDRRYVVDGFPEGIDVLRSLVDTGNRAFWDTMFLENRGGSTELAITHLLVEVPYDNPSGSSPRHLDHSRVPVVDRSTSVVLAAGSARVALDGLARESRYAWAGVTGSDPALVKTVARDLGKSGSDGGGDRFGDNPKYGGRIDLLCSEFVSWYYHHCDVRIGGFSFRDVTGTQQLHDAFRGVGALFRYHSGHQRFEHPDTGAIYRPKAGDFLERRGPDGAEHSMIVHSWDDAAKEAIVFNGPWPVTLRRVDVQHDETNGGKDFWVGCVDL